MKLASIRTWLYKQGFKAQYVNLFVNGNIRVRLYDGQCFVNSDGYKSSKGVSTRFKEEKFMRLLKAEIVKAMM